jgi:hypothetical protein
MEGLDGMVNYPSTLALAWSVFAGLEWPAHGGGIQKTD